MKLVRETLESFAQDYRSGNTDGMMNAQARIEMLMRRDIPEYKRVLDHLRHCIRVGYHDEDYEKLLAISSWILARAWQRIRIDSEKNILMSNRRANKLVTEQVQPLLDIVESYDTKQTEQR